MLGFDLKLCELDVAEMEMMRFSLATTKKDRLRN